MALQSQSSPRTAEPQPCAQPNSTVEPLADQSCNQWVKLTIDHDGIAVPSKRKLNSLPGAALAQGSFQP